MISLNRNQIISCLLLLFSVSGLYLFSHFSGPITQNLAYHHFADQRILCGVPHPGDVLSNLGFVLVGIIVFWQARKQPALYEFQQFVFIFFCLSCVALGLGSAYYHWNPNNTTLIWDRMTMVFGFSAIFMDTLWRYRVLSLNMVASKFSICFFIFCGSVIYWQYSNHLEPYVLVQFFTLLLILVLAGLNYKNTSGKHIFYFVGVYAIAKVLEYYDLRVWILLHEIISGHTLKHLAYALALYFYGIYMKQGEAIE
jgi:hypothetical protein